MGTMQMLSAARASVRSGDGATLMSGFFALDNTLLMPIADSLEDKKKDGNVFRENMFTSNPLQSYRGYGMFSPYITNMFKEGVPSSKIDLGKLQNFVDIAKNIMGYDMFSEWVYLQRNAVYLSETGLAFLKDCISYLETGIRCYNPNVMLTIIEATDGTRPVSGDIDELYSRAKALEKKLEAKSLSDVFRYWMMCPNGIDDFISSMFIFFGDVKDNEVV